MDSAGGLTITGPARIGAKTNRSMGTGGAGRDLIRSIDSSKDDSAGGGGLTTMSAASISSILVYSVVLTYVVTTDVVASLSVAEETSVSTIVVS